MVGYLFGSSTNRLGNLNSYFPSIYQARIILRSMAARYEGNGYGYCTVIFWAMFLEVRCPVGRSPLGPWALSASVGIRKEGQGVGEPLIQYLLGHVPRGALHCWALGALYFWI